MENSTPPTSTSADDEANGPNGHNRMDMGSRVSSIAEGDEPHANAREEDADVFQPNKRKKTSNIWHEFNEVSVNDIKKLECKHCKSQFAKSRTGTTSTYKRHLEHCVQRKMNVRAEQQTRLNFLPTEAPSIPVLHSGKFDMAHMREGAAHWVMMHEHPFTIVEEEGFNLMMRRGMPEWKRINRTTCKTYCFSVYKSEGKILKARLEGVRRISLTTDCWKSKTQKIEYMVITGHWIDHACKLQKRVLSFINIPPPRKGVELSDALFKCMKDWGIENKVFSITVDNASNNDAALKIIKETIQRSRTLVGGGTLFHVRCCAHVLNLCVQDGLGKIDNFIKNIRECVTYVNRSEARTMKFAECVHRLQLKNRKLVLDCKTRWNSTFEMLSCALKYKEAFTMFMDRDLQFDFCPIEEEWEKAKKICLVLETFWTATHVISGSEYPTSNLFLKEVYKVKTGLDSYVDHEDFFIRTLVSSMKEKFDKYWGESNMLMSIAAVLDPTMKMLAIEFCFPSLYSEDKVVGEILKVKNTLTSLYNEYVVEYAGRETNSLNIENVASSSIPGGQKTSKWNDFKAFCAQKEVVGPKKSELTDYLERDILKEDEIPSDFSCLEWWKTNKILYPILSRMATDILAIPISSVASESTFSAGTRVIDSYRSSLAPETVQVLLCGGDWFRHIHGVKKKMKKERTFEEVFLPESTNT